MLNVCVCVCVNVKCLHFSKLGQIAELAVFSFVAQF